MKKTHDNNAFRDVSMLLGLVVLALVLSFGTISLAAAIDASNGICHDFVVMLMSIALLATVLTRGMLYIAELLLGIDLAGADYADAYSCTNSLCFTGQRSEYDADKSRVKTYLYMQFTFSEINAFRKIMRRERSGKFSLPRQYFPLPIGNDVKLTISRRTVKKILHEMRLGEYKYVTLCWKLTLDCLGGPVWNSDEYLSLRDIRRITRCLDDKSDGVEVATIFQSANYRIDQAYLDNWAKRLNQENLHLSIYH